MTDSEAILRDTITRAANQFAKRQGCNVVEIQPSTTGSSLGYNITAQFDNSLTANYFTIIHAIRFNSRMVEGFVALDDFDL